MSEEEIKDIIEEILQDPFIVFSQDASFESTQIKATAIQGLLDLYQKEKEKKDKIREILEKYKKCEIEYGIYFYKEIQELLEENKSNENNI